MADEHQPRGVHLNGSIPLANTEEVLRVSSGILGERLRRIPDGETGARSDWIRWQHDVFAGNPTLERTPLDPIAYAPGARFTLRPGVSASDITFGALGYADVALASYAVFADLKRAGVIPSAYRFQVSLPTPGAPVVAFIARDAMSSVLPAYERALLGELARIVAEVPHDELAIQWDVAIEFSALENAPAADYARVAAETIAQLVHLGERVPPDVELGYHLCYGDAGHKHFVEPRDTAKLVEIANGIAAGLTRSLNWISMPVPRNRSDEAYFAPLGALRLHPETELYLGLVHLTDGVEGTRGRIAAARRVIAEFGVATECGFGRRPPESIPELLRIHSAVAAQR